MCGCFTLIADLSVIEESFQVQEVAAAYQRSNNIYPGQQLSAVIQDDKIRLVTFRWGLIPSWTKNPSIGNKMINARAETVAVKPSFKDAFKKGRCLIIANGFYEWAKLDRKKIPYHFSLKSGAPFGFAGLYETWMSPEHKVIKTCTIITTDANELVRPFHDRMPVIVPKDKEARWLNPGTKDVKGLEAILVPYPAQEMKMTELRPPSF